MEVNVAVYDTDCWRIGEEGQEGGGKEKVGARGKKPGFMIPGIVSSYGMVVFAVGVACNEIGRGGCGSGERQSGDDNG